MGCRNRRNVATAIRWVFLFVIAVLFIWGIYDHVAQTKFQVMVREVSNGSSKYQRRLTTGISGATRPYLIHWYNPPFYLTGNHPEALKCGFETCEYSNCELTQDKQLASRSDAVILDARLLAKQPAFRRPMGQIWIFAAHEPFTHFNIYRTWKDMINQFNWSMTFDRTSSDIYTPYGELTESTDQIRNRNFTAIALNKTKDVLMVSSHCPTSSRREEYVRELQKYVNVTHYGKCGQKWTCGRNFVHSGECFSILNTTFRYFLAFENALCRQYFTEKFYDNYNFDAIMITRGGHFQESQRLFPGGSHITTDSFKTIADLGKYLKSLSQSPDKYADALKAKSQYYSLGFKAVYQRAMCDLCKRLNHQDKYSKVIHSLKEWFGQPCRTPKDLIKTI